MRYWKRLNPDGSINTVESYSHNLDVGGAIEITEQEFNSYMASLPVIPLTIADLPKSNVAVILKSVGADNKSAVITRTWMGVDYDIPCGIAYSILKEFSVSPKKINIGDTVILTYLEHGDNEMLPVITDKKM